MCGPIFLYEELGCNQVFAGLRGRLHYRAKRCKHLQREQNSMPFQCYTQEVKQIQVKELSYYL